jgi:hypothetical protein
MKSASIMTCFRITAGSVPSTRVGEIGASSGSKLYNSHTYHIKNEESGRAFLADLDAKISKDDLEALQNFIGLLRNLPDRDGGE